MDELYELALFAGSGGGVLGGRLLGWRTICAVEKDAYCRRVLLQRQRDGMLDPFPIWDDIRTFTKRNNNVRPFIKALRRMAGRLVVSAGFPCQPFSNAGKQLAGDDDRNMWPYTIRAIREIRPAYAFLENVPGLLTTGYFDTILGDLAASGYDARWRVLSAAELGAPHQRDRLWIVAYPNSQQHQSRTSALEWAPTALIHPDPAGERTRRLSVRPGRSQQAPTNAYGLGEDVPDATRQPQRKPTNQTDAFTDGGEARQEFGGGGWWTVEPDVGRVADRVAGRVDRLRAIGNGQVPIVAATAWRLLTEGLTP